MTTPHTFLLPTPWARALLLFAAEQDVRHYLKGIHIDAGPTGVYAVATDRHTLAAGRLDKAPAAPLQVIIPRDLLVQAVKAGGTRLPAIDVVITPAPPAGPHDRPQPAGVTLTAAGVTLAGKAVEGRYPDWRHVARNAGALSGDPLPAGAVLYSAVDPAYAWRVQQAAALVRGKRKAPVLLRPPGRGQQCHYASLTADGELGAWVAPMRDGLADLPAAPAWEA
jgi:hypothetical protein